MKKALPGQKEVFLIRSRGQVRVWDFFAEEIVEAVNETPKNDLAANLPEHRIKQKLRDWMNRYLEEGVTDDFLNDLNAALHGIQYSKIILPLDLLPAETVYPRNGYIAQYDKVLSPEAYAADDFSKLLTSGQLERLKRCQMKGCENFFLGPPQATWCSKTCGSKHRVRKKRKRDSS